MKRILTKIFSKKGLVERTKVLEAIAELEVKSLPSDDPELKYWQGYADAQLHVTEAVEKL